MAENSISKIVFFNSTMAISIRSAEDWDVLSSRWWGGHSRSRGRGIALFRAAAYAPLYLKCSCHSAALSTSAAGYHLCLLGLPTGGGYGM